MSITTRCPFGCLPLQTELLQFKQISIDYFDQIMFKFNNQDKIINELVKKLDQCMNFNYGNGYGDQWQCEEEQTHASDEIENANESNKDVILFSTERGSEAISADVQDNLEDGELFTDDQVPAKSAVDLMGEMLEEPHFQTEAGEAQEEAIMPDYDEGLELEPMDSNPGSSTSGRDQAKSNTSSIRTSGTRSKTNWVKHGIHRYSSNPESFDEADAMMTRSQIRARYPQIMSTTTRCPFGCLSLPTELSEFKQISINYFDQIMFKFNNQDKIINELVGKLNQCLNFKYETALYGDQWQCEGDLSTDDEVCAKSAVDLMGEMLDEPHFQTESCETQEEATIPENEEPLEFESMGSDPGSSTSGRDQTKIKTSYIRTSGNRNKTKRLKLGKHQDSTSFQLFDAHTMSGSPLQIRERYSSKVDNCDGPSSVKCNVCELVCVTSNFVTHFEMVHFGKRFRCEICKWTHCQKINVYRHIERSHLIPLTEINQYLKVFFLNLKANSAK